MSQGTRIRQMIILIASKATHILLINIAILLQLFHIFDLRLFNL